MALKPNGYLSRIVDNRIAEDLEIYGTLSIEGPKNCGKTWAARNLLKIKGMFEESEKAVPPEFLCVICGMSSSAYMRPDGVYVVPITMLGP